MFGPRPSPQVSGPYPAHTHGPMMAPEAAQVQQKHGVLLEYGATYDMLLSDTLDHFRTIFMLERFLKNPPSMIDQLVFQIGPETQRSLIQEYYQFDATVIREILSKKLSSRYRNSLDDVSEKTKVSLRSCRRQFDNVKRVFKMVEEMPGSLVDNIKTHFLLSNQLAQQYAAIVFIVNNRFEIGKKKLAYLTFGDLVHCANEMIATWSNSAKDSKDHEDIDVDLSRDFLHDLRDVKVLADKELLDEHKFIVTRRLQGKLTSAAVTDLDSNFKNLSKALINIACGLNHSKELRDFFLDLVEKIIEPSRQAGWTTRDIHTFLFVYKDTSTSLDVFTRHGVALRRVWDRYMTTTVSCLMKIYHT
ncbi:Acidic fibroblast growth factor intracellular-binding protein [Lamellibrachia satsuma]|nr:Acidic fibroblast growth factor intracellular-binding protein [Lamellibrachia satsuma]